jgi:hypothetical protein
VYQWNIKGQNKTNKLKVSVCQVLRSGLLLRMFRRVQLHKLLPNGMGGHCHLGIEMGFAFLSPRPSLWARVGFSIRTISYFFLFPFHLLHGREADSCGSDVSVTKSKSKSQKVVGFYRRSFGRATTRLSHEHASSLTHCAIVIKKLFDDIGEQQRKWWMRTKRTMKSCKSCMMGLIFMITLLHLRVKSNILKWGDEMMADVEGETMQGSTSDERTSDIREHINALKKRIVNDMSRRFQHITSHAPEPVLCIRRLQHCT